MKILRFAAQEDGATGNAEMRDEVGCDAVCECVGRLCEGRYRQLQYITCSIITETWPH